MNEIVCPLFFQRNIYVETRLSILYFYQMSIVNLLVSKFKLPKFDHRYVLDNSDPIKTLDELDLKNIKLIVNTTRHTTNLSNIPTINLYTLSESGKITNNYPTFKSIDDALKYLNLTNLSFNM